MRIARTAAATDPGRRRRRNEDSYIARPPLFAVADGMGGAQAGEVASRTAVDAMGGEENLVGLIEEANRQVYARSNEDANASGMGTTMTAALVGEDGVVTIGHVGDSRAYLLRAGTLKQLTDDHSLVADLVRTGELTAEEAETHPQRSVITRALGTDPSVDVDSHSVQAEPGDLFLICSDGLTSMVDDDEILETVEASRDDLEAAAGALVRRANREGGEDNITVVFFELAGDDEPGDDEDTLTELDAIPVIAEAPPARTAQDDLDATARRVLAILAVFALFAVGVALLILGLR
ncbi:MAG: Stp1/IreP family PP2C-type Ser/Thr phosphatase [Gaiellaceae bacterium]